MAESLNISEQALMQIKHIGFWYAILFGFIVGSFLNVVIYRLPRVLFDVQNVAKCGDGKTQSIFANLRCLVTPGSMTPCCNRPISWFDNIPIISWLRLRGRCRYCASPISQRYFIVELLTGLSFAWIYSQLGMSWSTILYCLFIALMIALFCIDLETYYLPNYLTYCAIGLGLLGSYFSLTSITTFQSLLGACFGYLLPWTINFLYRLLRKRDGFGGGDFKLLAAFGAWFGLAAIMPILAIGSILGLLAVTLIMVIRKEKMHLARMLPFGPFLILGGAYVLFFGIPTWFF